MSNLKLCLPRTKRKISTVFPDETKAITGIKKERICIPEAYNTKCFRGFVFRQNSICIYTLDTEMPIGHFREKAIVCVVGVRAGCRLHASYL